MNTVTIVGGGIGGLSLAVGLKQRGIDFEVYEATDEYRSVGAGIIWQVNTMQALDRLGLAEDVQEVGARIEKYVVRDADDELVMEQDWAGDFEEEFGFTMYGVYRSTFQNILIDAVGRENIHMGKECVNVDQGDGDVTVEFKDGTTVDAEFVVGADGITSAVRTSIFPETTVEYLDCVTHRGLPNWSPPEELDHILWNVFGADGHVGFVPLEPDTREGYWFYTTAGTPGETHNPEDVKDDLLHLAADKPDRVEEMIASTPADEIISVDAPYVRPMETWTDGNVTLLGDAAHGMTPHAAQGGGMAIEDALALSICLDEASSVERATTKYEDLRIDRANEFVERSLENGQGAISEGAGHIEELRRVPEHAIKQQTREDLTLSF